MTLLALPPGVPLVVASASPRRHELLRSVGLEFEIRPADIDESVREGELPSDYVARLSAQKAAAVGRVGEIVVGADTTVEIAGQILSKPVDGDDALRMLAMLGGTTHHVYTGVTVIGPVAGRVDVVTEVASTAVTFTAIDQAMAEWYVRSGEGNGKAGGYAIQGAAAVFVARIDGSVTNVIGLPLAETVRLLRATTAA
jgi:septum formation protein